MPEQQPLFFDSIHDAVGSVVAALGGRKIVAPLIWPHVKPETAYTRLQHCLSEDYPEKLAPEEILFLARKGREIGCHAILAYLSMECGYSPPIPIDPLDETTALRREIRDQMAELNRKLSRLERIETQTSVRAVG
jgi:hypothetical protein